MEVEQSPMIWEKMARYSLDMLCTFDQEGKFLHVSDASKTILGYDSSELIGRHYSDFLFSGDHSTTHNIISRILCGTKVNGFENNFIHSSGDLVPLQWSAVWSDEEEAIFAMARLSSPPKTSRALQREENYQYKGLFENNPDVIYLENKEGIVTEVNQSFCKILGFTREEAINKPASAFLPEGMASVAERSLKEALLGSSLRFDMELVNKNQEHRIFDTVKYPIIVNGEVIGAQTIAKDITPMVRSYETIQLQANKLNTIFESITDAFLMLDKDWTLTYINSEAERLLHLDRKEHIGRKITDFFPEQVDGNFHKQFVKAYETGAPVRFTSPIVEFDLCLSVKAYPSVEGLSIYIDDVTETLKTREELEKLSVVASKTNNGVLIADKDWKTEWVNEGFTKLFGYSMEEAMGQQPSELLRSNAAGKKAFKGLENKLLSGNPISYEESNLTKDGDEVWILVEISPVYNKHGELTRFIEVHTDITALKQTELELTKLTKDLYLQNSDLQQFTYIVSHNLRSPVANILGLSKLMKSVPKETEKFDKSLTYLSESTHHLDTVLRDMSKILSIRDSKGSLDLEPVHILTVLNQAQTSFRTQLDSIKAKVTSEITDGLQIKTNVAYLYSIFYNLISNAIKYRSDERTLEIRIRCYSSTEKGTVISFSDNGSGFNMDKAKDHVFKLYKRFHSDKEGRGMGLYLMKNHVEALNGHIEVNSQVGEGTRFLIYLPQA